MKNAMPITSLIAISLISHSFAHASSETGELSVKFNDAKAVFIGRAIEGTAFGETETYRKYASEILFEVDRDNISAEKRKKWLDESPSFLIGKVRFTVDELYKGDLRSESMIDVGTISYYKSSNSCLSAIVKANQRYLLFADSDDDNLSTDGCRILQIDSDEGKQALVFLKNLPPVGSGGTIQGKIKWWKNDDYQPLANVTVHISGKDQLPVTLKTGPDGAFEIKHLLPGHYRVEPELPRFPGYHVDDEEEVKEVDLDDRGAAEVHFKLSLADESSMESAAPEVP
ncbi:MAG: carboxypeptidase-like regulatory domain-containing protein [Methylomicrobium sp.]